jgi:hypothetical protein
MNNQEDKSYEHANNIKQELGEQERVEEVLSHVLLRKGDVALLCSDGLHGPVTDEEILAVLIAEPNLQKAGEGLIQKALDRDGPDNITVALARFDGEALSPPAPEDLVSFVGYDPGNDPVPERMGTTDDSGLGRETVEERLPRDLVMPDDVPTKTDSGEPGVLRPKVGAGAVGGPHSGPTTRTTRSLLALFLVALIFAAAGGIFVMKCERDQSERSDSRVPLP